MCLETIQRFLYIAMKNLQIFLIECLLVIVVTQAAHQIQKTAPVFTRPTFHCTPVSYTHLDVYKRQDLYSRFAASSIYSGSMVFLMLLFATLSIWQPALLWFWITVISLCLAPFIFNPHQFSFTNFFVDYRNVMHWFSGGNSSYQPNSWANFVKDNRSRYTGYKLSLIHIQMCIRDRYFSFSVVPNYINQGVAAKDTKLQITYCLTRTRSNITEKTK